MICEECKLHKTYLERIIKLQEDEIEYLKNIQSNKSNYQIKEKNEINNSIFDIIDYNIEQLNINTFVEKIQYQYPAKETLINIIHSIIIHKDYYLISKEKSNIIKFIDKNNKIIYENIENFGIQICNYIFEHLKPIIENYLLNTLEDDNENMKENNRVQNVMLLKDSKFAINAISKILNRLN